MIDISRLCKGEFRPTSPRMEESKATRQLLFFLVLTVSCLASRVSIAGAASQLILTNDSCAIQPCPQPVQVPTTVTAGEVFGIYVIAADAARIFDPTYRGTVVFASTDPAATLPGPYTFVEADGGRKGFRAVLRSGGPQTITVSDSTGLAPGSLTLTVIGSLPDIPTLAEPARLALVLLLALVGVWSLRLVGWK